MHSQLLNQLIIAVAYFLILIASLYALDDNAGYAVATGSVGFLLLMFAS